MTDALAHRGPDGEGVWVNENETVALGHRRLSILDLSEAASQPFHFTSPFSKGNGEKPRYTIIHNGEIYNYIELREELIKKGYSFRSSSDTEVITAAYDCYKEDCLQLFDGMFAFAIWDEQEQQLFAARDRFGEKPFFYFADKEQFLFASELKALWAAGISKEWNHTMLLSFLANGHTQNATDASLTFYKNIFALPQAHYAIFDVSNQELHIHQYWDLDKQTQHTIKEDDAVEQFTQLLSTSVQRRLRSDVATGTSLSGGLDSSAIAAVIHQFKTQTFSHHCFTAGFPGFEKDELHYAALVAKQFNLQQHITTPTVEGFITDFQQFCYHQEQPFNSSSVYAQFKVMELAKQQHITVLLDGQGADETLAGYNKYIHWFLQELIGNWQLSKARNERKQFEQHQIPFQWSASNYAAAFLPLFTSSQLEERERKNIFSHSHITRAYAHAHYDKFFSVNKPPVSKLNDILYFNTMQQGLGELLHYADRNSMAHGRELRLPFLSHELVEFIFSLNATFKLHNGFTKYILRKAMHHTLPQEIVWRKEKVGYEPPQQQWMQNSKLQELIMESRKKLVAEKIVHAEILQKPIQMQSAYAADNFDWRHLTVAHLMP